MRTPKMIAALFVGLWIGFGTQHVFAQANNIARAYFIKIKPGHGTEFTAALKAHAQWRKQAGDPWRWTVYEVVNGRNLGDIIIRSGGHTWADLDHYADFLAKGAEKFNKTVTPHIASISSGISRFDTTLVNWVPDSDEVTMLSVTTYHLKPGQAPNFTQVFSKFHKAVKAHNYPIHYGVGWSVNGGVGQTVSLITPLRNWADMEAPEEQAGAFLNRTVGTLEAQNMFEQFIGSIQEMESSVIERRPELSVLPD